MCRMTRVPLRTDVPLSLEEAERGPADEFLAQPVGTWPPCSHLRPPVPVRRCLVEHWLRPPTGGVILGHTPSLPAPQCPYLRSGPARLTGGQEHRAHANTPAQRRDAPASSALSLSLLVPVGVFTEHLLCAWACHNSWEDRVKYKCTPPPPAPSPISMSGGKKKSLWTQ